MSLLDDIVAIDIHTHATVSTRNAPDEIALAFDAAMAAYFKEKTPRLTIAQTADFYRERRMLAAIFTVDTERETGQARIAASLASEAEDLRDFSSSSSARACRPASSSSSAHKRRGRFCAGAWIKAIVRLSRSCAGLRGRGAPGRRRAVDRSGRFRCAPDPCRSRRTVHAPIGAGPSFARCS